MKQLDGTGMWPEEEEENSEAKVISLDNYKNGDPINRNQECRRVWELDNQEKGYRYNRRSFTRILVNCNDSKSSTKF